MTDPNPIKPYLINAVLDYCRDNAATPYLLVDVDDACHVPMEYVRDGRIVFDISDEATNRLEVSYTGVSFQGRFGENNDIIEVYVPLNRIAAVTPIEYQEFALAFPVTESEPEQKAEDTPSAPVTPRRPMRVK